jgi:hypothetical protein
MLEKFNPARVSDSIWQVGKACEKFMTSSKLSMAGKSN